MPAAAPESMFLTLQNYCLNVVYKPGSEMYISDALSRATAAGGTPECAQHTVYNVLIDNRNRRRHYAYEMSKASFISLVSHREDIISKLDKTRADHSQGIHCLAG